MLMVIQLILFVRISTWKT